MGGHGNLEANRSTHTKFGASAVASLRAVSQVPLCPLSHKTLDASNLGLLSSGDGCGRLVALSAARAQGLEVTEVRSGPGDVCCGVTGARYGMVPLVVWEPCGHLVKPSDTVACPVCGLEGSMIKVVETSPSGDRKEETTIAKKEMTVVSQPACSTRPARGLSLRSVKLSKAKKE